MILRRSNYVLFARGSLKIDTFNDSKAKVAYSQWEWRVRSIDSNRFSARRVRAPQ